jgi:WD40 repeat protein
MRGGLPVQTFYGHLNSINDVVFNVRGDMLYSCDGDGIVKVWDVRKIQEMYKFILKRNTFTAFPGVSANCIEVDKSCSIAYVGHDNGQLVTINLNKNVVAEKKKAHEGSINGIGINLQNTNVFTVGSDGYLNVWN